MEFGDPGWRWADLRRRRRIVRRIYNIVYRVLCVPIGARNSFLDRFCVMNQVRVRNLLSQVGDGAHFSSDSPDEWVWEQLRNGDETQVEISEQDWNQLPLGDEGYESQSNDSAQPRFSEEITVAFESYLDAVDEAEENKFAEGKCTKTVREKTRKFLRDCKRCLRGDSPEPPIS